MPRTKTRRKPYQPILRLPPLPPDEYEALRSHIGVHGVLMPILIDEHQQIIDGDHRKRIATEFGYDCPEVVHEGLTEDEKRTLARAMNLARRQLGREQKRQIIADQLIETPKRSSRWVGKMLGVSHPTVVSVRRELESSGKIYHCSSLESSDGRTQPARERKSHQGSTRC
ncbi:MAG: ParB N-terminal domain-containing protein [Candidatus Nealsonbacteria bacterium]|nr:ParB N-terminal domain-containing protein [Candidatus Nealsonbacteria bacterium]